MALFVAPSACFQQEINTLSRSCWPMGNCIGVFCLLGTGVQAACGFIAFQSRSLVEAHYALAWCDVLDIPHRRQGRPRDDSLCH